jgi:hypothetical protein
LITAITTAATVAVILSFVTTATVVIALSIGGCGRPGCCAQGGDGRDEGFLHLRLPCAPSPAHPRKFQAAPRRLNRT